MRICRRSSRKNELRFCYLAVGGVTKKLIILIFFARIHNKLTIYNTYMHKEMLGGQNIGPRTHTPSAFPVTFIQFEI